LINEATVQLQNHKVDLADARFILDDVIKNHDSLTSTYFNEKCGVNSSLVKNANFESGCIKLLSAEDEEPNDVERIVLSCLKLENEVEEILPSNGMNDAAADSLSARIRES